MTELRKSTRRRLLSVFILLLVLAAGCQSDPTSGPTQDGDSESASESVQKAPDIRLEGIVDLTWGADTTHARERLGTPDRTGERRGKRPVTSYVYTDRSVRGYPTKTILYFGREDGLILVALKIPFDSDPGCEALFKEFEGVIQDANPSIEPEKYRDNPTDEPFCEAVKNGKARWEKGWMLQDSSSLGVLTLNPGDTQVEMAFTSSDFSKYLKRRSH